MPTVTPVTDVTTQSTVSPVKESPAPVETKPVEAKPVEAKPEDDKRFSELARREKMIRSQAKQLAEEKRIWEAVKSQTAQPKVEEKPLTNWQQRMKEDFWGAAQEAGLSYEDVVQNALNQDPGNLQIRQLMTQIKQMEEKQTQIANQMTEQQKNSYEQAKKQIGVEVQQTIKANPDEFEVLNNSGKAAQDAVVSLIEQTFEKEGYVMNIEDAAREVEEYLLEETLKAARLKKVQQKLSPTQVAANAVNETQVPKSMPAKVAPQMQRATTLTHTMTAQTKPLTANERYQRAVLAAQGKLNS